jgi:hypothetical protein
MEVEYTLTPEDLQAFNRYHGKPRGLPTKPFLIAHFGLIGCGLITFAGVPLFFGLLSVFKGESSLALFVGLVFGWMGGSLSQLWWQGWMIRARWRANCEDHRSAWSVRDLRVVLSPNELRIISRASTGGYRWSVVWRIAVTRKHAFLYLTDDKAIVIPRRVFPDPTHFEEFVALARQYRQDSNEEEPKSTGIIAGLPPQSNAITRPGAP